ncbi:MAG: HAD-IA family hydrolase [Saprospiraceae bacterium]
MKDTHITTLFLDIGGVLLTNGWGRVERNNAVAHFQLNSDEVQERHHLTFDTYEQGKLSLDEYLKRVIFYEPRNFSTDDFIAFMLKQSTAYQTTIDFFKSLKVKYDLNVIAVNNEGRELNEFRIKEFHLGELFDGFVSSAFVHLRKPDADLFRMAIDVSQASPAASLYIDDRHMFVEVAQTLGMNGIHYTGLDAVKAELKSYGLEVN